jgi:hypothetical protein
MILDNFSSYKFSVISDNSSNCLCPLSISSLSPLPAELFDDCATHGHLLCFRKQRRALSPNIYVLLQHSFFGISPDILRQEEGKSFPTYILYDTLFLQSTYLELNSVLQGSLGLRD